MITPQFTSLISRSLITSASAKVWEGARVLAANISTFICRHDIID